MFIPAHLRTSLLAWSRAVLPAFEPCGDAVPGPSQEPFPLAEEGSGKC